MGADTRQNRKLAAVLFADISDYTALMQVNEPLARQMLEDFHTVLRSNVASQGGQVINDYGDGCLCIFDSAVAALQCAFDIQFTFLKKPKVPVRLGLHSGDVFFEQQNVYGDSVNLASRIESLGVPGAVLFSETIRAQIQNRPEFTFCSMGKFAFKNVDKKMEVFVLQGDDLVLPKRADMRGKLKKTRGPIMLIAAGLLVSIMIIGLLLSPWSPGTQAKFERSLAILPFDTASQDNGDIAFTSAVSKAVRQSLSDAKGLNMPLSGEELTGDMSALNVAHVLKGDVERDGDKVVVRTRLIRLADGKTLWTDRFETRAGDVAGVTKQVANELSRTVPIQIEEEVKRRKTSNSAAQSGMVTPSTSISDDIPAVTGTVHLIPMLSTNTGPLSGVYSWTIYRTLADGSREKVDSEPGDRVRFTLEEGRYTGVFYTRKGLSHNFPVIVMPGEITEQNVVLNAGKVRIRIENGEGVGQIEIYDQNDRRIAKETTFKGSWFLVPKGSYLVRAVFKNGRKTIALNVKAGDNTDITLILESP